MCDRSRNVNFYGIGISFYADVFDHSLRLIDDTADCRQVRRGRDLVHKGPSVDWQDCGKKAEMGQQIRLEFHIVVPPKDHKTLLQVAYQHCGCVSLSWGG